MRLIILFIIGIGCFTSCEKELILPESETDPRVVVNCQFEADSTWLINLSESRPVLSKEELPYITNGTIKLLNESDAEIGTFTYDDFGNYRLTTPLPTVGTTYKIKVDVPGFETLTASSNAPNLVNIVSIDTVSKMSDYSMNFKINIQDEADVANYYSVKISAASFWIDVETMDSIYYEHTGMGTFEPYVANGYSDITTNEKYGEEFLFTDELFDGALFSFSAKTYVINPEHSGSYKVTVKSLSEDSYKYNLTLSKYYEANGDFFAEPVQVISNIENGLGIFGGSSTVIDSLYTF